MMPKDTLEIAGAGPAGLAAAIVAARSGRRVIVYERRVEVGARFHNDFQGLENWTTDEDVLEELVSFGIDRSFEVFPVREQVCYGPDDQHHVFRSARPFYYLVRRGPLHGSLDTGLKQQALRAGVELRLGQKYRGAHIDAVIASGPRRSFAVAGGYIFQTDLENGFYAVMNNRLAPGGYGYLLIWNGQATLAVCIFSNFREVSEYLNRTVRFFKEKTGVVIRNPRQFGGVGDVCLPCLRRPLENLAGEAAGIQDALWGFGIRYALMSGYIAGRIAIGDQEEILRTMWRRRIYRAIRSSFVNRFLYSSCGDINYRVLLNLLSRSRDPRTFLRNFYRPRWWKILFSPLALALVKHGHS